MIRDPSDGTVKEIPEAEQPEEIPAWKTALLAGKVKPERLSEEWVYQRAWNDGIDWSIKQIEAISRNGVWDDRSRVDQE